MTDISRPPKVTTRSDLFSTEQDQPPLKVPRTDTGVLGQASSSPQVIDLLGADDSNNTAQLGQNGVAGDSSACSGLSNNELTSISGPVPLTSTGVLLELTASVQGQDASTSDATLIKTPKEKRLVILYDRPRFYHMLLQLKDLKSSDKEDVRDVELARLEALASDPEISSLSFHHLNLCIEYTTEFKSVLDKFTSFLSNNAERIQAVRTVSYHIHFSLKLKWPQDYKEDEKAAYEKFLAVLNTTCGSKVVQCSIVDKYNLGSVKSGDKAAWDKLKKEIEMDISLWKNLKILDYGGCRLNTYPDVFDLPSLELLNLGGAYSLTTLDFYLPESLQTLLANLCAIGSIDDIEFPEKLKRLEVLENHIHFLDYARFPALLEHLNVSMNKIESLRGVKFPRKLVSLDISSNPIDSLKGVRFPESLENLDASDMPNESVAGIKFPESLKSLNLQGAMNSPRGLKLPQSLEHLVLTLTGVSNVNSLKLPRTLKVLYLNENPIKTLNKVVLPPNLRELYLGSTMITTLKNVIFPESLEVLDFDLDLDDAEENEKLISSLKDVVLPAGLKKLNLAYQSFKSVESFTFPDSLEFLGFGSNELRSIRDIKFGPNLKTLDLSGNHELTSIDQVKIPDSVTELRIPPELVNNLPAYIIERANKKLLVLKQSNAYSALKAVEL